MMSKNYSYIIRDRRTNLYLNFKTVVPSFEFTPQVFSSYLKYFRVWLIFVKHKISENGWENLTGYTDEDFHNYLGVEGEAIFYENIGPPSVVPLETMTRKILQEEYLERNRFESFWSTAKDLGYSKSVKYVFELNYDSHLYNHVLAKNTRAKLKSVGLNRRSYRTCGKFIAFFSREHAILARMVLDIKAHLDVQSIREKFSVA